LKIRILHKVIYQKKAHRFSVVVECPFRPENEFMFVFRSQSDGGDDCALLLDCVDGWDATNQELVAHSKEWNLDEWRAEEGVPDHAFEEAIDQLINVVGCVRLPDRDK
jgi:hypothetical protein